MIKDEDGDATGWCWFNADSAKEFNEGRHHDGNNWISKATGSQWEHESLYLTQRGRWVLNHWSNCQGSGESYTLISPDDAATWLVRNEHDIEEIAAALPTSMGAAMLATVAAQEV
jgi:hypothetical protein